MITRNEHKALQILRQCGSEGITASGFAVRYFTEPKHEYLFTAVSNQGNGACAGKKAWLCAGSYLGRLAKKGLVRKCIPRDRGADRFIITSKGENALVNHTDLPARE